MKKKFIVSLLLAMTLITSVVLARGIGEELYDNKKKQSNYVHLGSGDRVLRARFRSGSGTAQAMKVIKWSPDLPVASVSVSYNHKTATKSFRAQSKAGNVNQSYYIKWKPSTSSSTAYISITH
ncbi:hypothetical protein L0P54_08690 [Anaerosalibacter bizertensis]|uniref:Uncharacterized protein n=1 Tax=Anaerosalibacter bizertensis TaxID=932217 RepID=A0A9Q4FMC8_9FIRM|nr:hypothetical protein [Anaerosalibacter bizertensis]MBV1818955.1 hypothetical protein [Bacteroidales bacterium MSK.15.36]MCB5559950.1 hypothetical protein [Anaerosalibacter bizertensis]MCG4565793.1 hypothetical protein [Anaerosalibacter bizertensis]MCG4583065.1 hypothetical protein [Anaerosalibacter bizertensis]MCG4585104.1 hypothetical protein [Anaerosalibacter bizertensis]